MSKKTTKILSAILAASMAMSLMACNSKDDDEPGSEPGSVPGVSDPENTYYSSKDVYYTITTGKWCKIISRQDHALK